MISAKQVLFGSVVTGLAAVIFVSVYSTQSGSDSAMLSNPADGGTIDSKKSIWRGIWLGLAIIFAVLAFWLFGTSIPPIVPWLLHLCSIGLFFYSNLNLNKSRPSKETPQAWLKNKDGWTWLELGIFLAILAIAAFLRTFRLDQIPFGLWFDEANYGLEALRILHEPGYLPTYIESTQLPAHFIYLIAFFIRIFGTTALAIRIVSILFGLATVAAALLAGSELFNRRIGLVLAFFLAVSRWDINWSRIGMHGVTVPFFELLTVGFILKALRRQRMIDYALAGLSMGLGLCFYFSFRIFPLVIGLFLLVLWLNRHDFLRSSWRGLIVVGLGVLIASVPVTQLVINQPDAFWGRMNTVSIFSGKTAAEGWKAVSETTIDHLLMFNYKGDRNGRHNLPGEPMLDPISGALLILGTSLSLWRIRKSGSFLLIIWLLLMLAPGIFSLDFESPQSYRAIGSLPAAYFLAVVPIDTLWQMWDQSSEKRRSTGFILPLVLVLIGVGYINYHIYFDLQAKNNDSWSEFSTPETIIGKTMADLGPQLDYYVSVFYYDTPTIRYLAPGVTEYHDLETYDTMPIPSDGRKAMVFFVDSDREPFVLQAKHYYPNAEFKEYKSPADKVILYQITLKPSDLKASQGITVRYYPNTDWEGQPSLTQTQASINADWKDGNPAPFPFSVQWQGILFTELSGVYQMMLTSPAPSELYLDGTPVQLSEGGIQTGSVNLAKGRHELIIKTQGKDGHFELNWQHPDGEQAPIPPSLLFLPPIDNHGLLGSYFSNGDWQPPAAFTAVDPWIYFYYHNQPLPRPYTVEWVGRIYIQKTGHYQFILESTDESLLFIDENKVTENDTVNGNQTGEVDLAAGFHSIRIRYADRTGYTHIYLYWTPPNGEQEIVPQDVLFLP
ncbi:MAG TPA: PA14 domain-containing protein [Longilinea sp.]|nr:PA14 domain-containing protein [Longilinea sp.]